MAKIKKELASGQSREELLKVYKANGYKRMCQFFLDEIDKEQQLEKKELIENWKKNEMKKQDEENMFKKVQADEKMKKEAQKKSKEPEEGSDEYNRMAIEKIKKHLANGFTEKILLERAKKSGFYE